MIHPFLHTFFKIHWHIHSFQVSFHLMLQVLQYFVFYSIDKYRCRPTNKYEVICPLLSSQFSSLGIVFTRQCPSFWIVLLTNELIPFSSSFSSFIVQSSSQRRLFPQQYDHWWLISSTEVQKNLHIKTTYPYLGCVRIVIHFFQIYRYVHVR